MSSALYERRHTFGIGVRDVSRNSGCDLTSCHADTQRSEKIVEDCLRFIRTSLDSVMAITSVALTFAPSNNTKCLALRHAVQKTARAAGAPLRPAGWPFWASQR